MHRSARVRLASFADGAFAARQAVFQQQAREMDVFDDVQVFNVSRLPTAFLQQHGDFLRAHPRGFGYWIWKPQIIATLLQQSAAGDLVVYLDVGFTLNRGGRARLLEYLDIALDSPFRMLSFQTVHTEHMWTKADLAQHLGVAGSPSVTNTSQLTSGFIILGKTVENVELIQHWQAIAVAEKYRSSDDAPSVAPNREHRHDQSISRLLRTLHGTAVTHYGVQLPSLRTFPRRANFCYTDLRRIAVSDSRLSLHRSAPVPNVNRRMNGSDVARRITESGSSRRPKVSVAD